ncbi:MAG: PEGA domain-containing protein [Desulfobacterales bacterium]|nr:MAG: PEGA domain-containing protein [Desulfobacterales bacterium]
MKYGRYEVVEELGKGSMGVVYKAHDPHIDRHVALKVLRQERMSSENYVRRFLKEAKAIGRLSHPGIVSVYDIGQDQGSIYIAMELLQGLSLQEVIRQKKLNIEQIIDLISQVGEALDYLHRSGIIHRDIKPTNIIITPEGRAKITDFGIARIEDTSAHQQTQIGEILGTPEYMSPEQVEGKPVDNRSDLYSLGVILYELMAGRRPFKGDHIVVLFHAIIQETPVEPAKINQAIPAELSRLVMKSISKSPADRFPSGAEMAARLKESLAKPDRQPSEKPSTSRIGFIFLFIIIIISIIGLSFYLKNYQKNGATREDAPELSGKAQDRAAEVQRAVQLQVKSDPPAAQIFINGKFSGLTPVSLDLPFGKYEVRLSLPGYYEWEAQLKLDKEGAPPLSVRLVPM